MLNLLDLSWPTRVAIVLVLTLTAVVAGFVAGMNYDANRHEAQLYKSAEESFTVASKRAQKANELSAQHEQEVVRVRNVTRTIEERIPVYVQIHSAVRSCGLDSGGLRDIWNAANAGQLVPDPGKPAGTVP